MNLNYYNVDDEYDFYESEPDLRKFREKVLSKPNGTALYDNYINLSVLVKNDRAVLQRMSPSSDSYGKVKEAVDRRYMKFREMGEMLQAPLNTLEKIDNAIGVVTTDPLDKLRDVFGRVFSSRQEAQVVSDEQASEKPSLWNVFWK